MKKTTRIITVLFLCALMAFSSAAMPYTALANEISSQSAKTFMHRNPFYEGKELSYASLNDVSVSSDSVSKTYSSHTYYSEGKQLYKTIRDNLEKRNESFDIYLLSSSFFFNKSQVENKIDKLFYSATDDALSESSTDGDYIRWAVIMLGGEYPEKIDYRANGYYYYKIKASFEYYSSAEEEAQVDKVVDGFVSGIDTSTMTDYEIIKEIHDFICNSTTYDDFAANYMSKYLDNYERYGSTRYKSLCYAYSAYGALVKSSCVCQGYALAFYRLCTELGYSARFVSSLDHAWNIVELDGKYYFVDATWNDGAMDTGYPDEAYYYFLVNYPTLRSQDTKEVYEKKESHYLEDYYETEYFWENYRDYLDDNNYNAENKDLISQSILTVDGGKFAYTGNAIKPELNVLSQGNPEAYRITYKNNTNTGLATACVASIKNNRVLGSRDFVIIPKKMTSLSLADSGRGTDSLTVKWSQAPGSVTGYKLERYKDGKWSVFKTLSASTTSCKVTSLSPSTQYKLRIRSYKNIGKTTYYGAYSNTYSNATKPKTPSASSISTKSKSITFKWKKVSCSGYEIQYSLSSSMSKPTTKTASASSTSKTISKLKKGKKYYFRVRAYKTYTDSSGKQCKCYSAWSSKKNIKCK